MRSLSIGVLLTLLTVASGCGGPKSGTVEGTVTYDGKPLPVGTVTFFGEDNRVVSAKIGEDGSFKSDQVPVGEVKVSVATPTPTPPMPPLQGPQPPPVQDPNFPKTMTSAPVKTVVIPKCYADPKDSGLRLTVIEGTQPFKIELTK